MKEKRRFLSVILIVIIFILTITSSNASTLTDNSSSNFSSGTYNWTFYNSSGFLQLNSSRLNGTFTSQIFSVGSLSRWNNISWTQGGYYQQELPSNQAVETGLDGVNMTGNILLYHMNEASGTIVDYSGNGHNGIQQGGVSYSASGKLNTALGFDGNNDGINASNSALLNPSSAMTMSAWVYIKSINTNYGAILTRWGPPGGTAYFIGTNPSSSQVAVYFSGSLIYTTSPLPTNQWIHLLVTHNGSFVSVYNNSRYMGGGNSGSISSSTAPTSIGYDTNRVNYPFNGSLDEVAIWNRSLSASEILNLYKRGALKLNLSVQSCNDPACSGESFTNLGSNLTSPQSFLVANNSYFQYKFNFTTDNVSYTPELYNVTLDYTFLDVTPPQVNLNFPANETNTSSQDLNFNFTAIEDYAGAINCSLYIDGVLRNNNLSVVNNTLTNLNASGISEGLHSWNITCKDIANNQNWSETRSFYVDISPPTISNIVYSPNLTDDIDPGTNITINATITDNWIGISSVILQYYNGTSWENITTTNTSATDYNTTITTVSSEQNYTFNIWANDSFGNSNQSAIQIFSSLWDCTWSVSPSSLEEIIGFYEDKFVGNITLINTGDINYTNNNCRISFTIGYTGFSSAYTSLLADSSNWVTGNRAFQYSSSIIANASSNQTFSINASFPSTTSPFTEMPSITISSSINDSITRNKTASVLSILIIAPPNPLLYQEIAEHPATYVYLTPGNFSLKAYVRNLGYDAANEINTTAHNVSFNWTLPSAISSRISEGNETNFYEVLNASTKQYNNLTIDLTSSNIVSMPKGTLNLAIYSYGYKNDSRNFSLIENSGENTLLNETISIQFLCYDVIDSICVSACGIGVDPDCKAAGTPVASSSGGGGGGGGGDSGISEKSSAYFELLRGDVQNFTLAIENKFEDLKRNISISVSGIKPEYIQIIPENILEIKPKSSENITVMINAPAYFTRGEYTLVFTIAGNIITNKTTPYKETKVVTLYIVELERSKVDEMINKSYKMIDEMNSSNFILKSVLLSLENILKYYNEKDFLEVRNNYDSLKKIYEAAFNSKKLMEELNQNIQDAEKRGISVLETKKILYIAESSFRRGEYELALKTLEEAKMTYALETKGEFNLVYAVKNNPYQTLFGLIVISLFSVGTSLAVRSRFYKRKLKLLGEEEKLLLELMKVVQRECFENNKMSMEEYNEAMSQYETKLSKTIEERINIGTKLANLLKLKGKEKALREEKARFIELIKEIQDKYLNKSQVETRIYNNLMKNYTVRISEIEGSLAFIEAQEAMKETNPFRRIFKKEKIDKKIRLKEVKSKR